MTKLEQAMHDMRRIQSDIDVVIHAIGDAPEKHSDDELLNMLIGMSQMHQVRCDLMQTEYDKFVLEHVIDDDDIFR